MGMTCFVHKETGEVEEVMNSPQAEYDDEYQKVKKEIMEKIVSWGEVYCIEPPGSHDSYRCMERFVDEKIPNHTRLKVNLLEALERTHSFRNFRRLIDNSDYREEWFAFKDECMETYIHKKLESAKPRKYRGKKDQWEYDWEEEEREEDQLEIGGEF